MAGHQLPARLTPDGIGSRSPLPGLGEWEAPVAQTTGAQRLGAWSAPLETEVHLWYVEPEAIADPALVAAYDGLLSPTERERNRRFVFARHRHQDLVTRALVRTVLSTYCPSVDPRTWEFVSGPFGRPEIAAPLIRPTLRFNLSHTDGTIVCLVAGDREVGVDVEDTDRSGYTLEIADRFFSPDEARALRAEPAERQRGRFFDYWTLKEAYIKARGLGLQIPLDQFTFRLPGTGQEGAEGAQIGIAFGPAIDDDPLSWQFASFDLTARHRVAVAIRRRQPDLILRCFQTVPTPGAQRARHPKASEAGDHAPVR